MKNNNNASRHQITPVLDISFSSCYSKTHILSFLSGRTVKRTPGMNFNFLNSFSLSVIATLSKSHKISAVKRKKEEIFEAWIDTVFESSAAYCVGRRRDKRDDHLMMKLRQRPEKIDTCGSRRLERILREN